MVTKRAFRPRLAALMACLSLVACAVKGPADNLRDRPLLSPLPILSGARLSVQTPTTFNAQPVPGRQMSGYLSFLSPVAAVARNHIVYVADAGHRQIFRYDPSLMTMSRFTDYPATSLAGMVVAQDMSVYVADTATQQVLHFAWDGKLVQSFSHPNAIARPVAVVLDEVTGRVFVGDSLYNHVVVFNSLGRALGTLKSLESHGIESMARGPDGLYLVDRVSRQVVVMGVDGVDRYTIGNGTLKDPQAIAVDRFNRVFVSDGFDNTIKVYEGGQLIATLGGSGATPVMFNRITYLSVDQNTLYVADSLNARIQSFLLAPPREKNRAPE
ncbi:hypothetical protein EGT07_15580 [Herbaspirillum sp. HC18]|nr:hypothetical protein EGT07_15580 [Herbaspirillum sp. HC18]